MPVKKKNMCSSSLKENALTMATFLGVLIGIGLGIGLKYSREEPWTRREAMYVKYPGELFLNMLKCVIIPLVVPSLIAAIGSMNIGLSGKVGLRAIVYYLTTTLIAVTLGIVLVVSIKPGASTANDSPVENTGEKRNVSTPDTMMDLLRNCFPPNIVQATLQQYQTKLVYPKMNYTDTVTGAEVLTNDMNTWMTTGSWSSSTNILGLVVFAIVTGIAIAITGEDGKPLLRFFESLSIVMMKVTTWIIHLAPGGVCFLVAGQLLQMQNIADEFVKLAWYFLVVILGLSLHGFIILPLIYSIVCRKLPFRFIANMSQALMTAWGTASSSATLPITINCLEEKNGVDPRISRFVLPIGATINMDGTALYEAVAALFIAQMSGLDPSIGQILAISITATAASIGAAGIPQAGLVTMVMVLDTVGLPSDLISIIFSVDWLLDRFRTAINVLGDSIGAGIVSHLSTQELMDISDEETNLGMDISRKKNEGLTNEGIELSEKL